MRRKVQNLGRGASLLREFVEVCSDCHADVEAWHAPSECHGLVERGLRKQFRFVRKRIKAVTGLKFNAFMREVERRTSSRWAYFNLHVPVAYGPR